MSDLQTPTRVLNDGKPIIQLLADTGVITAGRDGIPGQIRLADQNNGGVIGLNADNGHISSGGHGKSGALRLSDGQNAAVIVLDASTGDVAVGKSGSAGHIRVVGANGAVLLHLDGSTGDITLANADCAEEFDISDGTTAIPGAVMIAGDEGKLGLCEQAYDRRVTGVVSGAGCHKPGIVLDSKRTASDRLPIAIMGKVYVQTDAQYGEITVGDLLTSSPTSGHAMRADDPERAFGAVIGKALQPLKSGRGLVLLLVGLQ